MKKNLKKNRYICICITLLYTWNIINQLYLKKNFFKAGQKNPRYFFKCLFSSIWWIYEFLHLVLAQLSLTKWTSDLKTLPQRNWILKRILIKNTKRDFPGGAVVENPPANAGDAGLSPGLGRSHMLWSNWAREPQLLSLRVWSLCSATREAATVRGPHTVMKSGPCLPQLEKTLAQKQRPNTNKNK